MSLRETYDEAKFGLNHHNVEADEYNVVDEVEKLREYWKPESTRVILLAESHVMTIKRDFELTLDRKKLEKHNLTHYPSHFVRFVYCLGSGERELLPKTANAQNSSK